MTDKIQSIIVSPEFGRQAAFHASRRRNEGGFALILSLVMLAVLTILGTWVFSTSTTELRIAGNARTAQNAFYAAESGIGYASNSAMLTAAFLASTPVWNTAEITVGANSFTASVRYTGSGPLPPGTMSDADVTIDPLTGNVSPKFKGLYFTVGSSGSAANNSQAVVEAGVVQVVASGN